MASLFFGALGLPAIARASESTLVKPYPGARRMTDVTEVRVAGHPVTMETYTTRDAPEKVLAYYASVFRTQGMQPAVTPESVGFFDGASGRWKAVQARRNGKKTLLVLSSLPVAGSDGQRARWPDEFPVPEGVVGQPLVVDQGSGVMTATCVIERGVHKVELFFRSALSARGWKELAPFGSKLLKSVRMLRFESPRAMATITVMPGGPGRAAATVLWEPRS